MEIQSSMQEYQARHIAFKELVHVGSWKIKVYTISKTGNFHNPKLYAQAIANLPKWLALENSFNASHDNIGFLIIHAASEAIFTDISWWVGQNMLNTHIFTTQPDSPTVFTQISGDGISACVWELDIINHERLSWLHNVIRQASNPDYASYLSDAYSGFV